jgi:hypothetical protein
MDVANSNSWVEFSKMLREEYLSRSEIQKLEQELWNLTMKDADTEGYQNCFHDMSVVPGYGDARVQ